MCPPTNGFRLFTSFLPCRRLLPPSSRRGRHSLLQRVWVTFVYLGCSHFLEGHDPNTHDHYYPSRLGCFDATKYLEENHLRISFLGTYKFCLSCLDTLVLVRNIQLLDYDCTRCIGISKTLTSTAELTSHQTASPSI